ncbi:MAG TPA: hypothetical protein VHH14_04295 [Solirubrobacterales bacterium]|nr:hypothetical protein [Solirubrobacterales bacterium]
MLSLLIGAVLLAAPIVGARPALSGKPAAGAEETVLRLHDLPPGYAIRGDSGCVAFGPTGIDRFKELDRWIVENRPEGCEFEYERLFRVPGPDPAPQLVVGETITTPSAKAAAEGFAIFHRLTHRVTNWQRRGTVPIGPGGPTATLFRFREEFEGGPKPFSLLFWRHGKLLAAIKAGWMTPSSNDHAALHYAQTQQRRLEAPSPYTEAEQDDTEVALDDPNLEVPVYWLGRTFDPGGPWPATELQTVASTEKDGLPGSKLELRYDGFNIETWTRQSWKRFQSSFLGKLNRGRCVQTIAFEWEQGHAVISAGYRRRTFEKGCPNHPPTLYRAAAHIGGVVIGVNQTTCRCLSPGFGPYSSSLGGMKTLLRGLTLRPKPVY